MKEKETKRYIRKEHVGSDGRIDMHTANFWSREEIEETKRDLSEFVEVRVLVPVPEQRVEITKEATHVIILKLINDSHYTAASALKDMGFTDE